jgi:hypothetical protein
MSLADARRVADAVLYEGYLLYPYRASSPKNQVRWQFGVVGPAGAARAGTGDPATMTTRLLVEDPAHGLVEGTVANPAVDLYLRFLQVQARTVERAVPGGGFEPVAELCVGPARWIAWHEAVAREIAIPWAALADLGAPGRTVPVDVPGGTDVEILRHGTTGEVLGRLIRTRWRLRGRLCVRAEAVADAPGLRTLAVDLVNEAAWAPDEWTLPDGPVGPRDLAARRSFVGTHLIVVVARARFVSLVDPPDHAAAAAAACRGTRWWPVLVGADDQVVLVSPIILDDHPAIAPESPGDLFDSTEIDEILTLRVMTLTDEEKLAARGTDPRAATIIDRCDSMPPDVFSRLHAAARPAPAEVATFGTPAPEVPAPEVPAPEVPAAEVPAAETPTPQTQATQTPRADQPASDVAASDVPWWDPAADARVAPDRDTVTVGAVAVAKGSRVRLAPRRRADAQDLFLAGRTAIVAAVYHDVDGATHVAVTLDDDPARDLHEWYGRYYYFGPEEIEPLEAPLPGAQLPGRDTPAQPTEARADLPGPQGRTP